MGKRKNEFLLFSLVIVFVVCDGYDYFQLVQHWQPAICTNRYIKAPCKIAPKPVFTIHSLWPSNYSHAWSRPCHGKGLELDKIKSMSLQLNQYWPDVQNGNNKKFWTHEWSKHGTCSENQFSEEAYFQNTLDIAKMYDLFSILVKAGIKPNGQVKKRSDIEAAIYKVIGKKPALRCNSNKSKRRQLHEIILCVAKNDINFENCTNYAAATCPMTFVWA